jgi:hypothetical protein
VRWTVAVLALSFFGPTAVAQQFAGGPATTANPDPNSNALCTVAGVVVKATTGEGVKRIAVNLISLQGGVQSPTAITDNSGRFEFSGVEPGRYTLAASGNGFPQQMLGQTRAHQSAKVLTLTPGSSEKGLIFRLTPPGVITGTIRDEDGDPVVGGQVQALRMTRVGGLQRASASGFSQTNDLGQYRIYGLDPGQYFIAANYQRPAMGNESATDVYLPTYYPSTANTGQATPVQVSAGDEVSGIDVELATAHSVSVRGRVVSEVPVKTLRSTYVSLLPRASFAGFMGGNYGAPVQDDLGNFEIHGVPPGSYVLSAFVNDGNRSYSGRALVDTDGANAEGVTVTVGAGMTLRGSVRLSAGATLDFSRLSISVQPAEASWGGAFAQVAADGTFALERLFDGTYHVSVNGFPEEFYLQSVRLGGADVLGPGLTISSSDAAGNLEVMLSKDGGRVDGVVRKNQQLAAGATVVLVPDPPNRSRSDLFSFKATDTLGRFSMLGLPPGDFKLFAWEPRDGVSFSDPDFIKDYEERGTRVHIEAKQQQSVELELIPADDDSTQ